MFFRIFLIGIISWAIFKLYRLLTGGRGSGPTRFYRAPQPRRYQGKAVDAEFEDLDEKGARDKT